MYEEKRFVKRRVDWASVIIKLILLFLIVFIIWYFAFRKSTKPKKTQYKGYQITENLDYLRKKYIIYFNEKNIPKITNDEVTVKLSELIDNKISKTIYDKNGNKCSATSSYGKIKKIADNSYDLKVYLKCKNEADSLIVNLTKEDIVKDNIKVTNNANKNTDNKNNTNNNKNNNTDNTNKNNNTNTDKNNNTNNTDKKNNNVNTNNSNNSANTNKNNNNNKNNNVTTNNNTNTNKTNNNKNTPSGNSTSNSASKNNSANAANSNKNNTTTNNGNSNNNKSNQNSNSKPDNTKTNNNGGAVAIDESKIDEGKITSDPSRIVYKEYLMYKLATPSTEPVKGTKYISYTKEIQYYKYCIENDMYNCHKNFTKTEKNMKAIQNLLDRGFTEYPDRTETIYMFVPVLDEKWSNTDKLDGYTYSGESRTHYRIN